MWRVSCLRQDYRTVAIATHSSLILYVLAKGERQQTQIIYYSHEKLILSWTLDPRLFTVWVVCRSLASGFDLTPPPNLVTQGLVQTHTDQAYLSMFRPTDIQSTFPLIGDLQRSLTVFPNHGLPLCKGSEG